MGSVSTASEPYDTIEVGQSSPPEDRTGDDTSLYPGQLVKPKTSTYSDGVERTDADYGDEEDEAFIEQVEIPQKHPQSQTPYDKSTAYAAGDKLKTIRHVPGGMYWLSCASSSASPGQIFVPVAGGKVGKLTSHASSHERSHAYYVLKTYASKTWVQGVYLGLIPTWLTNAPPVQAHLEDYTCTTSLPILDTNTADLITFDIHFYAKGTVNVYMRVAWVTTEDTAATLKKWAELVGSGDVYDTWGIHSNEDQSVAAGVAKTAFDLALVSAQDVEAGDTMRVRLGMASQNPGQGLRVLGAYAAYTAYDT